MSLSDVQLPSNRKFGFFFTAVFCLAGGYFVYADAMKVAWALFAIAGLFLIATLVKADILTPLNKLWMRLGLLMGMIISPIVLGVIFFGLFTPVSLVMKVFGRDELRLKLSNRASHWKRRSDDGAEPDSFKLQF